MTQAAPEMKALVHELNNRLSALLMGLELAADPNAPPEEHGPAIEVALRHSRQLAESFRMMVWMIEEQSAATSGVSDDGVTGREPPA